VKKARPANRAKDMETDGEMTGKKLGRRPLPEGQRRIQFGTRIAPATLDGLKAIAGSNGNNLGRVIDELVAAARAKSR
jgi:hypothetical protein